MVRLDTVPGKFPDIEDGPRYIQFQELAFYNFLDEISIIRLYL